MISKVESSKTLYIKLLIMIFITLLIIGLIIMTIVTSGAYKLNAELLQTQNAASTHNSDDQDIKLQDLHLKAPAQKMPRPDTTVKLLSTLPVPTVAIEAVSTRSAPADTPSNNDKAPLPTPPLPPKITAKNGRAVLPTPPPVPTLPH